MRANPESEENFRPLAEALPQLVWRADENGNINYRNRRWSEYTGLTAEAGDSLSWQSVVFPEDRLFVRIKWNQAVLEGKSFESELRLRNARDGRYRWHLVRAVPVKEARGGATQWFGTCTDIDDQKRLHEELLIKMAELNRSSRDRAQLIEREKASREASEMKSEYVARLSHEIRTPLNGVIGMVGVLRRTTLSEDQRELVDTIGQSADALLALVNDVLDISKIEAGQFQLDEEIFSLADFLEDVQKSFVHAAEAKLLGLDFVLSASDVNFLRGDRLRLRQVVFNLLHNAIKFTPRGRVDVSAWFQKNGPNEGFLRIEVSDTGIGMSDAIVRNLFGVFVQGDAATARHFGGSGLGLSICKKIIHLMKGEIGVESVEGHGSAFWFEVPLAIAPRTELPRRAESAAAPVALCRHRVLLVEDHRINQQVVRRIMELDGHHVDFAANGLEALRALESAAYDLVIMDCHMPKMDGITTAKAIRASHEKWRNVPIVALTADVFKTAESRCLAAGMNAYIKKPVVAQELRQVVQALLSAEPNTVKAEKRSRRRAIAPLIDHGVWHELAQLNRPGQSDLVAELVAEYVHHAPMRLQRLRAAALKGCRKSVGEEAHVFKSTSALIGAVKIEAAARRLEKWSAGFADKKLEFLMARFETTYASTIKILESHLTQKETAQSSSQNNTLSAEKPLS